MKIYIIGFSILLEFIALFLSLLSMGGGHGHYLMAKLFFPLEMLLGTIIGNLGGLPMLLAIIHYPLLGIMPINLEKRVMITYYACMGVIHIIFVFIVLFVGGSQFG